MWLRPNILKKLPGMAISSNYQQTFIYTQGQGHVFVEVSLFVFFAYVVGKRNA